MRMKWFLLLSVMIVFLLITPASAWLTGYTYRQAISITGDANWSGNLTNYPISLTVTNANGVSTGDTMYLNGSGSSFQGYSGTNIINDVRFTDTSDNLYDYWIENTSATSSSWPIWLEVPTIYKSQVTTVYMYYGNAAATPYSNIQNTFTFGDDFSYQSTINTTKWNVTTNTSTAINSGILGISSPANEGIFSKATIPSPGYEVCINTYKVKNLYVRWGFGNGTVATGLASPGNFWGSNSADGTPYAIGLATGWSWVQQTWNQYTLYGYHVWNIWYSDSSTARYRMDHGAYALQSGVYYYDLTNQFSTSNALVFIGGDNGASAATQVKWVFVRQKNAVAPILSIGNAGPTPDFTANVTTGAWPLSVQFTDTTYGYPVSWLWNFGDSSATAFQQNPVHIYTNPGSYSVSMTAGNANGTATMTKTGYITVVNSTSGYGNQYAARTVTIHVVQGLGTPLTNGVVTMQGVSTSTGSFNIIDFLLGINPQTTPIDTALMSTPTDSNGDAQFLVLPGVLYNVTVYQGGTQLTTINMTPMYERVDIFLGWNPLPNTGGYDPNQIMNFSVVNTTINSTWQGIVVTGTDNLNGIVNGTISLNQTNLGGSETNIQTVILSSGNISQTLAVTNYTGQSYFVRISVNESAIGNYQRTFAIKFPAAQVNPAGLPQVVLLILACVCVMGAGIGATQTTADKGCLMVCLVSWVCVGLGWFNLIFTAAVTFTTIATILTVVIFIGEFRRKNL